MNEYDEAFHETVLEAVERAKKRASKLQARAVEAKARADHVAADALRARERVVRDRSPRST